MHELSPVHFGWRIDAVKTPITIPTGIDASRSAYVRVRTVTLDWRSSRAERSQGST